MKSKNKKTDPVNILTSGNDLEVESLITEEFEHKMDNKEKGRLITNCVMAMIDVQNNIYQKQIAFLEQSLSDLKEINKALKNTEEKISLQKVRLDLNN